MNMKIKGNNDSTVNVPAVLLTINNNGYTVRAGEAIFCNKECDIVISSKKPEGDYERIGFIHGFIIPKDIAT